MAFENCKLIDIFPTDDIIATLVASVLSHDNDYSTYVISRKLTISDPDAWNNMCQAAAWIILQQYYLVTVKEREEER